MSMMKTFVFGLVFLFAGALAQDKPCTSGSDCEDDECCLDSSMMPGKRQMGALCRPRGDIGDDCYVSSNQGTHDTVFNVLCPCHPDQMCNTTGVVEVGMGEHGICAHGNRGRRANPCTTTADCASDECCVNLAQLDGKKRQVHAECRQIGGVGDSCLVSVTTIQDLGFACPCASGLTCKGTGMFDMPLGEIGTCT